MATAPNLLHFNATDARKLFELLDHIHLVAIPPDPPKSGGTDGRYFGSDIDAAVAWAGRANENRFNIYWTGNFVSPGCHKKPTKGDIQAARLAHCDIDPPKDGGPWDKLDAIGALTAHPLPPSMIIDSGNGLQPAWLFADPARDLPAIESINIGLRDKFGEDACWNIDRLLRVPGSVNFPGLAKRQRGCVPRMASWVQEDTGQRYEPGELAKAFPAAPRGNDAQRGKVDAADDTELLTADDLELPPLSPIRSAIEHPPGRDNSGDLLACARLMANAGYSDGQIFGVLYNQANAVSAHAFTQRDPRRAVLRAIELVRSDSGKHGPSESASATSCEPVDLWGNFIPPVLPGGLLPPILEEFARVNGEQMGADPAGLAVAALVTCAAAIPDAIRLKVKRHSDWYESARLWAALVADPSGKKTPIISAATGPLCRLDLRLMREWLARVKDWQDTEGPKGPKPAQTRLRIEDTTVEGAQQVLEGSPWGVLLLQDELSGFFGAMDRYGGGNSAQAERAFWLRAFNGGPYAINRVTRGAAVIDNLSVSMLGGIQPEPLRKIAGGAADDGLLQRLFPVMLRRATMGRDEPAPPVNDQYRDLIEQLHDLRSPGFMNASPLEFTDEAQGIRRALEAKHLELQSLESINRKLASHIGKYDGLFARLCIVWHCVENVGNPHGLPVFIEAGTTQRAADFLHGFLLAHAVAFYGGVLGLSDDHDRLTSIAGHILAHRLDRVTNRDIARGDRTMRGLKDFEVRPLLEQLEALGWLERVESPRPSGPPHFAVNPIVHERFADKAKSEAERRRQARETIAGLMS